MRARGTAEAAEEKLRLAILAADLAVLLAGMAGMALGQQMDWRYGRPGVMVTTNEQDRAALRTYHYGSPDIVESPEEWFTFDSDNGAITGFNWQAGREHVVIPWDIGGVQVVSVGDDSFSESDIVTVVGPKGLKTLGHRAFFSCSSLTSVTLPNATTFGMVAFSNCSSLTSVTLPNATTFGDGAFINCSSLTSLTLPNATMFGDMVFASCSSLTNVTFSGSLPTLGNIAFVNSANAVVYVDNPIANGWGETFGGRPVVRRGVSADWRYLGGAEYVRDSATNVVWRSVISNGWHWLQAYTNQWGGRP